MIWVIPLFFMSAMLSLAVWVLRVSARVSLFLACWGLIGGLIWWLATRGQM